MKGFDSYFCIQQYAMQHLDAAVSDRLSNVPCSICMRQRQIDSAICRATYTPLAEAWERECVTPLPSPMM